jgi:hypothetical protein
MSMEVACIGMNWSEELVWPTNRKDSSGDTWRSILFSLAKQAKQAKQSVPNSFESWDASRTVLPRSLLVFEISFYHRGEEWHCRAGRWPRSWQKISIN